MLEEPTAVRARIGLIIPSSNRLTEPQMRRYAPADVEVHVTRLRMTGASHVPLPELLPRITEATAALDDARCDAIVFHCTASSMEAGLQGERRVLEAMRQVTSARSATTASATLAALHALAARRIVLLSPYIEQTHQHEVAFLEEAGVSVVGGRALELVGSDAYIGVAPSEWLRLGIAAASAAPVAAALFLSCTNTHTPQVVELLEAATGRAVITSNQAVLWHALRLSGVEDVLPDLGRLFHCEIDTFRGRPSDAVRPRVA